MRFKYQNNANAQAQIMFEDGTSVFLKRGDVHVSDKPVKRLSKWIKITEVRPSKRKTLDEQETLID